jgi:hypothetical protein
MGRLPPVDADLDEVERDERRFDLDLVSLDRGDRERQKPPRRICF